MAAYKRQFLSYSINKDSCSLPPDHRLSCKFFFKNAFSLCLTILRSVLHAFPSQHTSVRAAFIKPLTLIQSDCPPSLSALLFLRFHFHLPETLLSFLVTRRRSGHDKRDLPVTWTDSFAAFKWSPFLRDDAHTRLHCFHLVLCFCLGQRTMTSGLPGTLLLSPRTFWTRDSSWQMSTAPLLPTSPYARGMTPSERAARAHLQSCGWASFVTASVSLLVRLRLNTYSSCFRTSRLWRAAA